jgi:phospholipid/cholesterol/gamma-HCH transport system substrate-binding protein
MNEQTLRFRVGVFVLAGFILLAVLITLFGGFPTFFSRHDTYTVIFNDAPGVARGTPVRRSGVRIGEVQRVDLDDATGKVRVTIVVERSHPIYESDQVVLVHGLLSGDTSIDFVPQRANGEASEEEQAQPPGAPPDQKRVPPGSVLKGTSQPDVARLVNQAAAMTPAAEEALKQIRTTLQRFDKMAPLMEDTLREYRELARLSRETVPQLRRTNDEAQAAIRNWGDLGERVNVLLRTNQDQLTRALDDLAVVLRNARAASGNFESLAKNSDEFLKQGRKTLERFNDTLTETDKVLTNVERATKPLAERGESITKNLEESVVNLNKTLVEARDLLRSANKEDGSLRKFLEDPGLYNNLSDTVCGINRLLPRVDRILQDVEVFADKIARHPESLGLGGVVSPGSGIKNAPSGGWPRNP